MKKSVTMTIELHLKEYLEKRSAEVGVSQVAYLSMLIYQDMKLHEKK